MLGILLLAASTAAQPLASPSGAVVWQATASVRILPGARISAGDTPEIAMVREARISTSDGGSRRVRLVEFL